MTTRVIHWASLVLIPALLVGIYTLRWPVGVIAALGAAALLTGVGLVRYHRLDLVGWLIVANVGLWLVSGLAIGGVTFQSLIDPVFYNGIGRIFLYYLPLVVFCTLPAQRMHLRMVRWTLLGLAGLTLVLLIAWLGLRTPGQPQSFAQTVWTTPFIGLLTSTTGAGTLAGAIWLFIEIHARRRQSWKLTLAGLPMLVLMATATSRQAVLAAFATYALFILIERRWRLTFAWFVYAMVVYLVMIGAAPNKVYRFENLISPEMIAMIGQATGLSTSNQRLNAEVQDAEQDDLGKMEQAYALSQGDPRFHNSRTRLILWRRALDRFLESPLLGIGFGRFNDLDRRWAGVPHLVWFAVDAQRVYAGQLSAEQEQVGGSGSAHNSYLHVLAETGLVGLGLLGLVWGALGLRFTRGLRQAKTSDDQPAADYFQAARLLLVFTLLGALVGHALAAPSVGVVVMTIAGVGLAYERGRQEPR